MALLISNARLPRQIFTPSTTPCVADLRKQMESSELRNQRLKEVFQRKIQEFRTVCYILTGYQIDVTTENQYRLTSVYAEHMEDSLLFKKVGDDGVTRREALQPSLTVANSPESSQNTETTLLSSHCRLNVVPRLNFCSPPHTFYRSTTGSVCFSWLSLLLAPECEVKRNIVGLRMAPGRLSVDV